MTPDQIQGHLEAGTFTTVLLDNTDVKERVVNGKSTLTFKFPTWFYENVSRDSQIYAMELIAKYSVQAIRFAEYHPQILVNKDE